MRDSRDRKSLKWPKTNQEPTRIRKSDNSLITFIHIDWLTEFISNMFLENIAGQQFWVFIISRRLRPDRLVRRFWDESF